MGKGEYDNQAYQMNNAPPPPYQLQAGGHPVIQQPGVNYGGPQVQNTTNVVQVQGGGYTANPNFVIIQQPEERPNFTGQIVFSCAVFWCVCPLFGCIAFFISIAGMNSTSVAEAKSMYKASNILNITGLVLGVISITIILSVIFTSG